MEDQTGRGVAWHSMVSIYDKDRMGGNVGVTGRGSDHTYKQLTSDGLNWLINLLRIDFKIESTPRSFISTTKSLNGPLKRSVFANVGY